MHDGRYNFIIPHNKSVIKESHPPEDIFPHNHVSKYIDDDMKRTGEFLGCNSCEKYLCPYIYVTEERDPRGVLSIIMASI